MKAVKPFNVKDKKRPFSNRGPVVKPLVETIGMAETVTYLEKLIREMQKSEAEIVACALQTGLKQLWREQVLGRYLRGEISRDKAIELAGIDWVELAEHQHKAMLEDLEWALET